MRGVHIICLQVVLSIASLEYSRSVQHNDDGNNTQIEIEQLEDIGQQNSWNLGVSNMCKSYQEQMNHISFEQFNYSLDIHFGVVLLQLIFGASIAYLLLYSLCHHLLSRFVARYKQYSQGEQLVATTYVIACATYTIQVVPFTYVLILFVFGNPIKVFVSYKWLLASMFSPITAIHLYESVIRTIVKPRILIVIHHLGFLLYAFRLTMNTTFFSFKLALIIMWILECNFILYLGVILYMFYRGQCTRLIQYTITIGLVINTLAKIVGAVMAFYMAACSDTKRDVLSYFLPVGLILFFLATQMFTYKHYVYMIYNAGKPREQNIC